MTTTTPTVASAARARRTTRRTARSAALSLALAVGVMAAGEPTVSVAGPARMLLAETCSSIQPCRLSTGLPPSFTPERPVLTPDGDTAVFAHTAQDRETRSLYSVPVRGGTDPVRLDPPNAPPSGRPQITADGERVLFLSERAQGSALFSAPINGPTSAAVRLSPAVVGEPQLSPDSRLVAFRSVTGRVRVAPVEGPESRGVPLTPTGTGAFALSANARNLVYIADGLGGEELFRVPLTLNPDQQPTRLSGPMVDGGGVHSFRLPDGAAGPVVYSADQETANVRELYSVSFGGANRTKLNVPLPSGWSVGLKGDDPSNGFRSGYGISPDGSRVAYVIQTNFDITINGLFSVPSRGPADASTRIDVTAPNILPAAFFVTRDSRRAVYLARDGNGGPGKAFSVPIEGPAQTRVPVSAGGEEGAFVQVSPDGVRVVSRMPILNETAVLSGPVDQPFPSPEMIRLNGSEHAVGSVEFDPTSRRVSYIAERASGERDLFSSALRTRSRYNLTGTLNAAPARLVVSDQHAVYAALVSEDAYQLYSSRLAPGSSG